MTSQVWKVAVIGAGPAGMFATDVLTSRDDVHVHVFEKLFAPDGLLRFGVAPDHPSIKRLSKSFDKTRARPNKRFFGGIRYGEDMGLDELKASYHHVIFAHGAASDRRLGIPGEETPGVFSAREFVEWYNGHPEAKDYRFPLDVEEAVVVGAGNVALDVARILLRPIEDLETTDIANHALEVLRTSKIRRVHLLVRRGPANVSFTLPEIRNLASLEGVRVIVSPDDFVLTADDRARIGMDRGLARILEVLESCVGPDVEPTDDARVLRFHFFTSPIAVEGEARMTSLRCIRNERVVQPDGSCKLRQQAGTGFSIPAEFLLRSIGYQVAPTAGLPYDEKKHVIRNVDGQVVDDSNQPLEGIWVTGWARRGPSGVVGTNKADAQEVAKAILAQCEGPPPPRTEWTPPKPVLVDCEGWRRIDEEEQRRGEKRGRPREKFVRHEDVAAFLDS